MHEQSYQLILYTRYYTNVTVCKRPVSLQGNFFKLNSNLNPPESTQAVVEDLGGFRKLDPSHYYFTWGLAALGNLSNKNVPLVLYVMVDFEGLRMLLSLRG